MKTRPFSRGTAPALLTGLLIFVSNSGALACPFCQGDTTNSKMGAAADWGIMAMVGIMVVMLSAIAAFGWHLAYRAKHPLPDYQELLNGDEGQPKPEGTV